MAKKIVTRFAPSPTGWLHIGGLRTALFSYLVAKKNRGSFLLRIEDTDQKRLIPEAAKHLQSILKTFGLNTDGPVVIQSVRAKKGIYQQAADKLIIGGHAYYCFCTPERLQDMRLKQSERHEPPRYDGRCRQLATAEVEAKLDSKLPSVVRLKFPEHGDTTFKDEIRGDVTFDDKNLDDAILLKSDGFPTYHLANVVDDHDSGVTHVIRGEEWLPSAPIHGLVYDYLGFERPLFFHLPLILNPDHSKLSKRQGDVAVEEYLRHGYLKEALINYIAFLGWNPGDDREIFTFGELIKVFDLKQLNKSAAVFDRHKLDWYNAWYLRNIVATKNLEDLYKIIEPFAPKLPKEKALQLFTLTFQRLKTLEEMTTIYPFLWQAIDYPPDLLIFKKSDREKTIKGLESVTRALQATKKSWTRVNLDIVIKKAAEDHNLTFGDTFWPVRVALSGSATSPSPAELLEFFGPEESFRRLRRASGKFVQN